MSGQFSDCQEELDSKNEAIDRMAKQRDRLRAEIERLGRRCGRYIAPPALRCWPQTMGSVETLPLRLPTPHWRGNDRTCPRWQ